MNCLCLILSAHTRAQSVRPRAPIPAFLDRVAPSVPYLLLTFLLLSLALGSGCSPQSNAARTNNPPTDHPTASNESPSSSTNLPPIPHEVYVWNSSWTPAVQDAVIQQRNQFQSLLLLASEISWKNNKPNLRHPTIHWPTLLAHSNLPPVPFGLVIRVGHHPSILNPNSPPGQLVVQEVTQALSTAATHLPQQSGPTEIQLDFDCPERALALYAVALHNLRQKIPPSLPLTITALPSWLDHPDFPKVLKECQSYVLQVHTLGSPSFHSPKLSLCDTERAHKWVQRAAQFQKPFRVALPTYSYRAAFQPDGTFLGVSAEAPNPLWPPSSILRTVESDPLSILHLVHQWQSHPPPHLQSILWFRLPTPHDQLNWSAATLSTVLSGKAPQSGLHAATEEPEPGLIEIRLTNTGSLKAQLPSQLHIRGPMSQLIAADSLPPFQIQAQTAQGLDLVRVPSASRDTLNPSENRAVGWLRFSQPTPVTLEVHEHPHSL